MSETDDPLLTEKETAIELNVSRSFLAKARAAGTGPEYVRLSKRLIRYPRSKLREYRALHTCKFAK